MIRIYSQLHRKDEYLENSSVIGSVWPNGWVLVYDLRCSGFEPSFSHSNCTLRASFEQRVPWHSGNYRVQTHSETCLWHDKSLQSIHHAGKYSEKRSVIWSIWPNCWLLVYGLSGSGFESSCSHLNFKLRAYFEQGVPWHCDTIKCGFTLKDVCDMIRPCSQLHLTDKYSEHTSCMWSVWPNG